MNNAELTYEEFLNDLRSCTNEPEVTALLENPGNNLLYDLLVIVDTFATEKKFYEAEKILQILANAFNEPEFYSSLALSQKRQCKFEESKINYKKSISLDSSLFKIFYNYGILLCEMKEYEEAVDAFQQSINLNPDCYLCYYNLGNCYREIEEYGKAKDAYEKALFINPDFDDAVYNLGVVEEALNLKSLALNHYDRAIKINQENIQAHWNKSLLLLQQGDYLNGFNEYEWRLKKKEFIREFPFPEWKGEDLSNKNLLIYCEQGFGDAIQFLRFIKQLNAACITVECRKELKPLFDSIDYIDHNIIRGSSEYKKYDYDYYVSIMSLPYKLGIVIDNINNTPYLKAENTKSGYWKEKINSTGKIKIGIVWSGNPIHQNDKYRSVDPDLLMSKLCGKSTALFSLQINPNKKERQIIDKYGVNDFTDNIKDFSDTAAFIENLDLIVSVDTSTAHLAGAMGKETWILLPYNPDWRWMLNGIDSHWYQSVKLFRQKNKDDWTEVFRNIELHLNKKLEPMLDANLVKKDKADINEIYNSIEIFINNNEFDKALKHIEIVLLNDQNPFKAFNYLGILFAKTKNFAKAEEYFIKTINMQPDFSDALSNLGVIYFEHERFEESIQFLEKAVSLNRDNYKSYFNLAYAFQEVGEIEKATECYNSSIILNPNFADAHFNLALLNLLKGNYQNTWKDYNYWAFKTGNRTIRDFNKPKWNGDNFSGKVLYIYPDQGFGDVIQFIRYLPFVKERGGEIIFECQPALFNLLKNIKGFDKIVKTNPGLNITENYDLHIPLQNLPEIFNTSLDSIPPYSSNLNVSTEINEKWKNKIGETKNYKVGFVWSGNQYPPINRKRHLSLTDFIPLFNLSNVDFYSLQVDGESKKLKQYTERFNIFDFSDEIENFEDTAAIINNLDLVITIDTSIAHLSGAMGKKVYTMLPFIADWRWGLNSSFTPWYKSMKLFRQSRRGRWESVIDNVINDLEKEI